MSFVDFRRHLPLGSLNVVQPGAAPRNSASHVYLPSSKNAIRTLEDGILPDEVTAGPGKAGVIEGKSMSVPSEQSSTDM